MDLWKELLCLSFDSVLFAFTYSQYSFYANTLRRIKEGEEQGINPDPENPNFKTDGSVIVKGSVAALTSDLVHSFHSPHTRGVVQKITVTEHNVTKNATGFWSDCKHLIQEVTNTVPFVLKSGKYVVEVSDVRESYILDLDTVAAKFEPTKMSAIDYLLSFFNGVRQRGIETTEEMLKEGTILTGIGELTTINDMKVLGPPSDGSAYILTVTPISSLVRRIKDEQSTMRWLLFLFGTVGVMLLGLILKRGYKFYILKMTEKETRRRLEETRRERRSAARNPDEELPETQRCVVCRHNPREIIILPCGHLCLCEDCSSNISNLCPICRGKIDTKAAVFL